MRPWERGWDSVPLSAKRCKFQPICSGRSRLSAWLALNEAVCLPECILPIPNHAISLFSFSSLSPLHHACVIISLARHQWSLSAGLRLTPLCHRSSDLNALEVSKTDRHFKDLCSYKVPTHSCVLGPERNIKQAIFQKEATTLKCRGLSPSLFLLSEFKIGKCIQAVELTCWQQRVSVSLKQCSISISLKKKKKSWAQIGHINVKQDWNENKALCSPPFRECVCIPVMFVCHLRIDSLHLVTHIRIGTCAIIIFCTFISLSGHVGVIFFAWCSFLFLLCLQRCTKRPSGASHTPELLTRSPPYLLPYVRCGTRLRLYRQIVWPVFLFPSYNNLIFLMFLCFQGSPALLLPVSPASAVKLTGVSTHRRNQQRHREQTLSLGLSPPSPANPLWSQ